MDEQNIDAVALNPGSTLTYLTGLSFHLMERPTVLLISKSASPVMVLPKLEAGKLLNSRLEITPITFDDDPSLWQSSFVEAVKKSSIKESIIGVEATRLRFLELNFLREAAPNAKFVDANALFSNLRIAKDADEISKMRKAVQIAQDALNATLPMISAGRTEKEIASELIINMLRLGNDPELPFAPIVAAGPNGANPHAMPSDQRLKDGDLLVIDWGASYQGYFSDLTRTFAIGHAAPEMVKIYQTVLAANEAGRATGKPGIAAGAVDQAARNVIDKAGYGDFFTHRTGHGLGMEGHETPYIFGANNLILNPGMVYTVEPGIYIPDCNGVRIEDDVVVTSTGSESLSDFPRELTVL
jgi:Xaa-Pro dipeptidase